MSNYTDLGNGSCVRLVSGCLTVRFLKIMSSRELDLLVDCKLHVESMHFVDW